MIDRALKWLEDVTLPSQQYPPKERPWTLTWNGKTVTVATDGWRMFVIPGAAGFEYAPTAVADSIIKVLESLDLSTRAYSFDTSTLRHFIGLAHSVTDCSRCDDMRHVKCTGCGGTGRVSVAGMTGWDCGTCWGERRHPCPLCLGWKSEAPKEAVSIGPAYLNRELLARTIVHLPDGELTIQHGTSSRHPVIIRTEDDWLVLVMGMRVEEARDGTLGCSMCHHQDVRCKRCQNAKRLELVEVAR